MDTIIIAALAFLVVVAVAPFLLMRGQFGKPKGKAGKDGGADIAVMTAAGSGGGGKKSPAGDNDNSGDGGSDGGDGGGGGE
jgi:hypothetical protein